MTEKRLGVSRALVGDRWIDGDVSVEGSAISGIGLAPAGRHGLAAPGFVDLQVNGFAGVDFLDTDTDGYERAGRALAATGVTSYQPTFISSPLELYRAALKVAGSLGLAPRGPRLLGVHLEGPFISPERAGAHNPGNILEPDLDLAAELCDSGPVTYMTLAPERPGGGELIDYLTTRGMVVAAGHTDADAQQAHAGFDRGARAVTHIYNAQRRWSARDPGIAGVSLARADVVVQAIVDLVHLAPETVLATWRAARERFAVVTDAIMAAGLADGDYRLGDRKVHVRSQRATLADGTLAGSVATMDASVRNLVELGIDLAGALVAGSRAAAKLVGRAELGELRAGTPADIVVLDDSLEVVRTLVAGDEVHAA